MNAVSNVNELVPGLLNRDNKKAYKCLMQLKEKSSLSSEMLDSDNSYIRARGILLIAVNIKWD